MCLPSLGPSCRNSACAHLLPPARSLWSLSISFSWPEYSACNAESGLRFPQVAITEPTEDDATSPGPSCHGCLHPPHIREPPPGEIQETHPQGLSLPVIYLQQIKRTGTVISKAVTPQAGEIGCVLFSLEVKCVEEQRLLSSLVRVQVQVSTDSCAGSKSSTAPGTEFLVFP